MAGKEDHQEYGLETLPQMIDQRRILLQRNLLWPLAVSTLGFYELLLTHARQIGSCRRKQVVDFAAHVCHIGTSFLSSEVVIAGPV